MNELALQFDAANGLGEIEEVDFERRRKAAIAVCKRRIEASIHLYKDGEIDREEYAHIRETNEREIAHWQTYTTERQKLAMELAMCMEAVEKIARVWDISSDEDRQGLVRSLFEYVVYDLDKQRIVDFRLKGWADRFLVLGAALYDDDEGTGGDGDEAHDEETVVLANVAASDQKAPMGHLHT